MAIGTTPLSADMIDTSGMKAWEHCALCHGLDGNSRMAKFPKLAGQRYDYLVKQLKDFKSTRRENDGGPMAGTAEQFSMAALESAAQYYSALALPAPTTPDSAPSGRTLGKRIFERGLPAKSVPACVSCHGAQAPRSVVSPRLESQHAAYLEKQLTDFRETARANDPDGVMRRIAKSLSLAEIAAVTAYVSGLPRPKSAAP